VFPACIFGGQWLAEALFDDPRAIELGLLGTRWLPWAVPAIGPFFLLRSTFDGLQRPLPGLFASLARTLLLVGPLVWVGLRVAPGFGQPEVAGAYAGLTLGAGIAAAWLGWQAHRVLRD
jgi:Na+-driven multidrug efflux pump